jgi:hypothetical protein
MKSMNTISANCELQQQPADDLQEAAAFLHPRSCCVVRFCRSDSARRMTATTDKTLYSGLTTKGGNVLGAASK